METNTLLEIIETLRKERDEARRMVCELEFQYSLECGTPSTIAGDHGWNCFKREE